MIETTSATHMRTVAVVTVVLLLAALAAPVGATTAKTLKEGHFEVFASGGDLGYDDIVGTARMMRSAGETEVEVEIASGLVPRAKYGSHVHAKECKVGFAGGHYQFPSDLGAVEGAVFFGGGYEIWPGPFKANRDGSAKGKTTVSAEAGDDAVSVVIHAPTGEKIACADLLPPE